MSTYHDDTDILRRCADILRRKLYSQCLHQIELWADFGEYLCMTDSTENATPPKFHQIESSRFLSISRYKFTLRFWFDLNVYREIWISWFGGFRTCSMNLSYSLHALMAENNSADRRIFSKVNWTISLNDKLSCYLTLENVCALFA